MIFVDFDVHLFYTNLLLAVLEQISEAVPFRLFELFTHANNMLSTFSDNINLLMSTLSCSPDWQLMPLARFPALRCGGENMLLCWSYCLSYLRKSPQGARNSLWPC